MKVMLSFCLSDAEFSLSSHESNAYFLLSVYISVFS